MKILGPHRSELIQQKDEDIQLMDEEIAEIEKAIQDDTMIANDGNEEPAVRERAHEKMRQNTEKKTQRENERAQLVNERDKRERSLRNMVGHCKQLFWLLA